MLKKPGPPKGVKYGPSLATHERTKRWDPSLTKKQLMVNINNMIRIYGLRYKKEDGRLRYEARKEVIEFLRKRGFTLHEIGRLYGVTRQRIEQIEKNEGNGGIR